MRKVNPQDVRAAFADEISELTVYLNRARRGLEDQGQPGSDISRLVSTSFLSLYVSFERFTSDLFLAYLNRDFSRYQRWLENRISSSIKERMGLWAATRARFTAVKHVKASEIEHIVDADGRNLTFSSSGVLKQRARDWLIPSHSGRIMSLTADDDRLIDTARAVRDFIAHESASAKQTMNTALSTVAQGAGNQHLGRGGKLVHNVGVYLKAIHNGKRRTALYAGRLNEIAQKM